MADERTAHLTIGQVADDTQLAAALRILERHDATGVYSDPIPMTPADTPFTVIVDTIDGCGGLSEVRADLRAAQIPHRVAVLPDRHPGQLWQWNPGDQDTYVGACDHDGRRTFLSAEAAAHDERHAPWPHRNVDPIVGAPTLAGAH